ncbi:PTS sugar transporter subunit IIA [Staphylococcus gallinarum]|uniref:PTS sugar transporter subunit IIA n=1 Tax=Staphylococcus TaxID=1279 RepID=UPI000D1C9DE0|nr:PTS sugar transporter subunit IIA [Staphylococcus gallinarum]MCD8820484.1 PTS sugar transporter subunit IIA [Staphylococcus gallinarum]MCD8826582.1 PTS sugar transporter subunit IIA [Staphylococcus gallinarum]PTE74792.1 hypothetical protein BUY96_12260 [Staphylococcus gallinarum]PTK90117.1 hypothetical protein BUZ03_09320 [Staphylococcus gallinarum]PTL08427.1 hypothetical protein BUZ15_11980 [Staphylococcus gallinarum]
MNEIIINITTNLINYHTLLTDIEKKLIEMKIINKQNSMLDDITIRDAMGSVEIYPNVLLPHIRQHYVNKTRIILVRNMSTPIIWQKKKVNLIILVLMPINANENDKNTIRNFMKCLANEDYIQNLITKE